MTARSIISATFERVAQEQHRALAPLLDDLKLVDCGLDSLSFALIVAHLEDAFGFDPFEHLSSFPVLYGDFLKLYERPTTCLR